jgi:ABC-type transport system substrate-binding protein
MDIRSRTARLCGGLLTLTMLLAACTGTSEPSTAPTDSVAPAPSASATSPDEPVSAAPSGDPSTDPGQPIGGKPILPKPGQAVNVHAVPAEGLEARVDGTTILVRATWTSGVEPCTILDSIVVDKGEGTYTVTLREGSSPQEIACIAIAEQHFTEFEIPDVAPGTWSIVDSGGLAPAVEVTIG